MHDEPTPLPDVAATAALLEDALFQVKRVIVGQDRMVERTLVCLLARGHCLIEGVPGLAKTLTVSTVAKVIGGTFSRLQFTPDLVPADIVGTRIWRPSREEFGIEWGPVFANVVLVDEINRAPAKVQSALLEVMAERHVSIGGHTRPVPNPFLVLATQNPIESEGVYALPEAQRDRFLMQLTVEHPSYEEETEIARRMSVHAPEAEQVLSTQALTALQADRTDEGGLLGYFMEEVIDIPFVCRQSDAIEVRLRFLEIRVGKHPEADTLALRLAGGALEGETVVAALLHAAQPDRVGGLVAHDQAHHLDVEIAAGREIACREHQVAGARDVERRIEVGLRDGHRGLLVGLNDCQSFGVRPSYSISLPTGL